MPVALILAGGTGERFWPASSEKKPKQFLPLTGNLPVIRETVERVRDLTGLPKVYVVTTRAQFPILCETLSDLPTENIIVEPEGRNTAPCLLLSVAYIKLKEKKDEVIAVLPSDHYVEDNKEFQKCLKRAYTVAETEKKIITIGIKPDRPETDYGYIAVGTEVESGVFNGLKFIEKPDYINAKHYVEKGYLWNSGIFVFDNKVFLEMLKRYSPGLYSSYTKLKKGIDSGNIKKIYMQFPKVSIDYALMESVPSFLVIPGNYGWDDLGTWRSLETVYPKDSHGNIIIGDVELTDVSNCVIYSPDKLVAVVGVKDSVIAVSENGVLICHKEQTGAIKHIVKKLKSNRRAT